jgi:hypothetical protein
VKTFIFKINFLHEKKIVREIEVPENSSLYDFASSIVDAVDFQLDHCFGFYSKLSENYYNSEDRYELFADLDQDELIEPSDAKSVKKTQIRQVWKNPGDKMLFLFDYGDDWLFKVELKSIGEKRLGLKYPRLLKITGKAPEQYPEIE